MSRCFDISCHDCKVQLWISQGNKPPIYTGEPKVMEQLGHFLYDHEGHRLSFDYDETYEYEDYEIENKKDKEKENEM